LELLADDAVQLELVVSLERAHRSRRCRAIRAVDRAWRVTGKAFL